MLCLMYPRPMKSANVLYALLFLRDLHIAGQNDSNPNYGKELLQSTLIDNACFMAVSPSDISTTYRGIKVYRQFGYMFFFLNGQAFQNQGH